MTTPAQTAADAAAEAVERQLAALLAERNLDAAKLDGFAEHVDTVRRTLPEADRFAIADRLRRFPPSGDIIRLNSVLFQLTGDLYHLERILHYLLFAADSVEPDLLHYTYWCIQRQMFLGTARPEKASAFVACDLFRFYQFMIGHIARRWNLPTKPRRPGLTTIPTPASPRRIALITNQFTGDQHQPSRDCFDFAHRLHAEHGVETMIFNANLMPLMVVNVFIPPFLAQVTDEHRGIRTIPMFGQRVKMASFTERSFNQEKLASIIDGIHAFNPDCLISFGGSNVVADLFAAAEALPVVCIPTTAGLTISLAPLVLGFDPHDWTADIAPPYRLPFASRFRPFTFGYSLPPLAPDDDQVTLPEDAFIFAVVGTRLDLEVSADFIALLEHVLDGCAEKGVSAAIVFAGPVTALPRRLAGSRQADRMTCVGHLRDIRSFYRRTGALLNPPRQGGGGSAAYALAEGVPVVSLPHGDVISVAGPDAAVPDVTAYVARAVTLATDSTARTAAVQAARDRFEQVGDRKKATRDLLDYCREAMNTFRAP